MVPLHIVIVLLASPIASEEPSLDVLLRQARSGDWRATAALGNPKRNGTPTEARRIVDAMVSRVENGTYDVTTLSTLRSIRAKFPTEARRALPCLIRRLHHQTARRGYLDQVIRTVGLFDEDAKPAVPSLRRLRGGFASQVDRTYYGIWATAALARIEAGDEQWAKWLAQRLRLGRREERMYVLQALAYAGPRAKPALPDIQGALKDSSPAVRTLAAGALASIDQETAAPVPVLVDALCRKGEEYPLDPWGPTRHIGDVELYACIVLGWMGCRAKAALPALRKVQHGEKGLSDWAALAIRQIEQDCEKTAGREQPQGQAAPARPR